MRPPSSPRGQAPRRSRGTYRGIPRLRRGTILDVAPSIFLMDVPSNIVATLSPFGGLIEIETRDDPSESRFHLAFARHESHARACQFTAPSRYAASRAPAQTRPRT